MQLDSPGAPTLSLHFPAGQSTHTVLSDFEKDPALQFVQFPPALLILPIAQPSHTRLPVSPEICSPASQILQVFVPLRRRKTQKDRIDTLSCLRLRCTCHVGTFHTYPQRRSRPRSSTCQEGTRCSPRKRPWQTSRTQQNSFTRCNLIQPIGSTRPADRTFPLGTCTRLRLLKLDVPYPVACFPFLARTSQEACACRNSCLDHPSGTLAQLSSMLNLPGGQRIPRKTNVFTELVQSPP